MSTPYVRTVDAFCGAGGLGWGLYEALHELGLASQSIAINHDDEAVATHLANLGYARHYAGKVEGFDPQHAVPSAWNRGWDIYAAGWPCQHHSRARGGRPKRDQMRTHAWEVQRWHSEMRGRWLVGENVPEWRSWGPLCNLSRDHRGKCDEADEDAPVQCDKVVESKKGQTYLAWRRSLEAMGWNVETRVLNAADFGAATDRERLIIIGRRDGGPIPWPEPTHAKHPERVADLFGFNRKPWRAAAEVIDFANLGRSMYLGPQRKAKWAVQTLRRVARGALKYWGPLGPCAVLSLAELGLPRDSDEYLDAAAAAGGLTSGPFHVPMRQVADWLQPLTCGQQGGAEWRRATEPFSTFATGGATAVLQPLLFPYYGQSEVTHLNKPLPTVPTRDRFGKLVAVLIPHWNEREGQLPRMRGLDQPLPTITSRGAGDLYQVRLGVGPSGSVSAARQVVIDGQTFVLDIFFRMLTNAELAAATGFPPGYVFVGNDGSVKRQIGNAVPPPLARAVFRSILQSDVALRQRVLHFEDYLRERPALELVA